MHKFPVILDSIGTEHKGRNFAIIIDEAHSSQSGSMSAQMNIVLSGEYSGANDEDDEDRINRLIEERIKGKKMLKNASYFAFTAHLRIRLWKCSVFHTRKATKSSIGHSMSTL